MVIDKIRKMSIKGLKSKLESFFSISPGVLEKNLRGGGFRPPPGPDRVKVRSLYSEQVEIDLCAVFQAFTLHVYAWGGGGGICILVV